MAAVTSQRARKVTRASIDVVRDREVPLGLVTKKVFLVVAATRIERQAISEEGDRSASGTEG